MGKVVSIARRVLLASISLLATLAVVAPCARATTLYASTIAVSTTDDWATESRAAGQPSGDCNSNNYAVNGVSNSGDYLEVASWGPFTVPAGYRISKVEVDVHARYDLQPNTLHLRVRVKGSFTTTLHDSQNWPQNNTDCDWRMEGPGWDITYLKPEGWTAADITSLGMGVRRIGGNGGFRVDGFRVNVTLELCLPAVPSPSTSSPSCGIVRIAWPAVANASDYTVYRNGIALSPNVTTNIKDDSVDPGISYSYMVQANGPCGSSAQSPAVVGTPNGLAPAPTGVRIDATGCGIVRLVWTYTPLGNAYHVYHVYRDGAALATCNSSTFDDSAAGSADHCYEISDEVRSYPSASCGEGARSAAVCGNGNFAAEARQRRGSRAPAVEKR
jgi:hypothetical protein